MEHVARLLKNAEGGVLSGIPAMHDPVARFFMQAVFIMAICRGLTIFTYVLKQPVVVFEIIGGILMGPSAFGRNEYYLLKMFPKKSLGNLSLVANIGLVLYLFMVGMELDPKMLVMHFRKSGMISAFGMIVPFCLGIAISRVVFNTLQGDDPLYKDVSFTAFFVFMGTAMSITAFPVLARMLKEGGLIYTRPGALAMGAAAVDDATAWCLLILAISLANAKNLNIGGIVFATVFCYGIGLFVFIRPALRFLVEYVEKLKSPLLNGHLFALCICLCFLSAWVTYVLGVHFIFGAFLFGLVVPRDTELFHTCIERMEQFVLTFTLPIYFALSGLKTDISQIHSKDQGAMIVLVCVIACAGKMIGAGGAALANGMSMRESAVIATLMNTRGLVELIVLNVGLDSGILSTKTFSVMVIMALFTTFLTTPILEIIYPESMRVHYSMADKKIDEPSDNVEDNSLTDSTHDSVDILKQHANIRLGLVVDKVEQMHSLVKFVSAFAARDDKTNLSVTAIHMVEPTHTNSDEFLALNEKGVVVNVKEQITDIDAVLELMADPNVIKKPVTLPLCVHCNSIDTNLNAYEVRGDPLTFAKELRDLSKHNDCSLVAIPWRSESEFIEKLIWDSISALDVPIAVFTNKSVKDDRSEGSSVEHSVPVVHESKARSGSIYGMLPAFDVKSSTKVALRSKVANEIVAVITGQPMDVALMNIVARLSSDRNNHITVFIAAGVTTHAPTEEIKRAVVDFTKQFDAADNVKIVNTVSVSTDIPGLFRESKALIGGASMFLCSFAKPSAGADIGKARSNSLSTTLVNAIVPSVMAYTPYGRGRFAGAGEVSHLELGQLGSMVYDDSATSAATQIIVLHEGERAKKLRRSSVDTELVELGVGNNLEARQLEMINRV